MFVASLLFLHRCVNQTADLGLCPSEDPCNERKTDCIRICEGHGCRGPVGGKLHVWVCVCVYIHTRVYSYIYIYK